MFVIALHLTLALIWLRFLVLAQPADPVLAAIKASEQSQRSAAEAQSAGVRRQIAASTAEPAHSFFTVPWSSPSIVDSAAPLPWSSSPLFENELATECELVAPESMDAMVEEISKREGLTPDLLRAVIHKESRFLPCAVSRKGAQGLMQLMPETADDLGVRNAFDPEQNVRAGARMLKQMLTRYNGDLRLALGAYNAGPGKVDLYGGVPPYPETLNYVADILEMLGVSGNGETSRPAGGPGTGSGNGP